MSSGPLPLTPADIKILQDLLKMRRTFPDLDGCPQYNAEQRALTELLGALIERPCHSPAAKAAIQQQRDVRALLTCELLLAGDGVAARRHARLAVALDRLWGACLQADVAADPELVGGCR